MIEHRLYRLSIVANGEDVATCSKCQFCPLDYAPKSGGPGHGEIVGKDTAMETQLPAQHAGYPPLGEAGWQGSYRRKHDMGAHDPGQVVLDQQPIGSNIRL